MRTVFQIACLLLAAGCASPTAKSRDGSSPLSPRAQQLHDQFTGAGSVARSDDPTALQMKALAAMREEGLLHQGLTAKQVLSLLGEPYYRATDPSAEWRYALPGGGLSIEFDRQARVAQFSRWFESDQPVPRERW